MEKAKLEYIARITMPDGSVVEKKISVEDLPGEREYDLHNVYNYLKTFDVYEQKVIQASKQLNEELSKGYLEEVSKKGGIK